MGRDSEKSERSIRSEPRWTAWRTGETEQAYYERHGRETPKNDNEENDERKHLERKRAEQMQSGNRIYCPNCRSSNVRLISHGYYECLSQRPKWSCIARQGFSQLFTLKDAMEAGSRWVNDIRRGG